MNPIDTFHVSLLAAERGAATVYHAVLQTGVAVSEWQAEHPALKPLMHQGLSFANGMLTRAGIPGMGLLIVEDVIAALQNLAAHDATVPSAPTATVTTTTTSVSNLEQDVKLLSGVSALIAEGEKLASGRPE
jgi:hypothetical protein